MDKSKVLAMIIGVLILCEGFGVIYFASRTQALSRKNQAMAAKMETIQPGYTKMSQETDEAKAKYEDMAQELESVKKDRENILAQTKSLLANRARVQELEEEMGKVKASVKTIEDEKVKLKEQTLSLRGQIKKLKEDKVKITAERDEINLAHEKLQETVQSNTVVRGLNEKVAALQRELKDSAAKANEAKNQVAAALAASEKRVAQLTQENAKLAAAGEQLKAEQEELTAKIEAQKNDYSEAVKKNKSLELEMKELPGKFVEVSRQNKVLLKQTAGMHYNLGVFYTKHKDYGRAASEFAKALEINPNDAYAHFNLGYIYAEYMINRHKAMEHFRHFLRLSKGDDPDINWARKYLLVWETYDGKRPVQ